MDMFVTPQLCPQCLEGHLGKAHYQEEKNGSLVNPSKADAALRH